ncbi:MAG: hypothetical protein QMD53_04935 [Actinomycetota bacterium]|nr:hypothetical protein [Actinomycetota bacterium]
MGSRKLKVTICAFLVGVISTASVVTAYAAMAYSNWRDYGPVMNINYQNRAKVFTDANYAIAYTDVKTKSGNNVPAGYMGAYVRLYKNGTLIKESKRWEYTNSSTRSFVVVVLEYGIRGSNYYSKGISASYNGNGYNTVATYQSPSLSF